MRCRPPAIALLSLLLAQRAPGSDHSWSPPSALDPRDPVEIAAQSAFDPAEVIFYAPVLFAGVPNALEVVRVDVSAFPPTASPVPVATGNIFALGTMVSIPGEQGFSFVDGSFDARFGHCAPPCDSATNSPVVTGTFVDSDSATSLTHFWVAALNNSVPRRLEIRTSPDAINWTLLYIYTPPESAGVCGQYNGCGRINLVVDRTATDVATASSCLTFEVKTSTTETERRALCSVGNAPQFVTVIDTDSPYPSPVLDRVTDTELLFPETPPGLEMFSAYKHRRSTAVRIIRLKLATLERAGPVTLGAAPPGSASFGLSMSHIGGEVVRILWAPAAPGLPANDIEWNAATGTKLRRTAPADALGQMSLKELNPPVPAERAMYVVFGDRTVIPFAGPAPGSGLAISSYRLPLFDDSFETENLLRSSATSP